jgi:DNA-binding MarR family transcriptional regulator
MGDQLVNDVGDQGLFFSIFLVRQRIGQLLSIALADSGLSPTEYAVYSALAAIAEPVTPTELADRLSIRPSTLTGYLTAMSKRGHLSRLVNHADRRSFLVQLSRTGREACAKGSRAVAVVHQQLRSHLGTAHGQVAEALGRLDEALLVALQEQ